MNTQRLTIVLAALLVAPTTVLADHDLGVTDIGQTPFYAQTSAASNHRDSRNSDFYPFVAPAQNQTRYEALDGAMTLLAPSIGPDGTRYVTTGRGPGTSHLHAFDADGNLLWESAPQVTLDDLGPNAVASAPLIDKDGHVYISDGDQLWSFRANGAVRWVSPLPPPDNGTPGAPMITCILTNEGFVGGITTDGKVVLFHRHDGSLAIPIFELPKGVPPTFIDRAGLWAGGLVDPAILRFTEDWFFGDEVQVANTPSVHPQTGRIYITAAGPLDPVTSEVTGLLYGLDIVNGEIQIAFAASMGGGSGTSPTISPDGSKVYAADNEGIFWAFDAETGAVVWAVGGIAIAGSPGLGPDGTVYGANSDASVPFTLIAVDPADGSVKWAQSYSDFAATLLPPLPAAIPPLFPTAEPIARVNTVVSSSAQKVWVSLTVGYHFFSPTTGRSFTSPRANFLVAIDPADGSILSTTEVRDTTEGLISIGPDGTLHLSLAAIISSLHWFGVNPVLQQLGFPQVYHYPGPPPIGGIQVYEPVSVLDHAIEGIEWVRDLNDEALAALSDGDAVAAFTPTRRGRVQLGATADSIDEAREDGEIGRHAARRAKWLVRKAEHLLTSARHILAQEDVGPFGGFFAGFLIHSADHMLKRALSVLSS